MCRTNGIRRGIWAVWLLACAAFVKKPARIVRGHTQIKSKKDAQLPDKGKCNLCRTVSILFMLNVAFLSLMLPCLQSSSQDETGQLSLLIIVVDELTPKPVPFTDFRIIADSGEHAQRMARTDENGKAVLALPPGDYVVENVQAVTFKGKSLLWKKSFRIATGGTTELRLTDADAAQGTATSVRQVSEEAKIYQKLRSGVVAIESDLGSGSGFVVDDRGLALTNQHVSNKSPWSAVRFGRGIRTEARIIEEDPEADVAVLQFNKDAFTEFAVIPLADVTKQPIVVEGEKVLAIGSPLGEEKVLTTGILSKVESDVFISDININPGNSGGPLLDLAGEAVGINTFTQQRRGVGPGISGVVAIQKALPVLERARLKLATVQPPPAKLLPDVSPIPIPPDALQKAVATKMKPVKIEGLEEFIAEIRTPFYLASLAAERERELAKGKSSRVKKRSKHGLKDETSLDPQRCYERVEPVVEVCLMPKLEETAASKRKGLFRAVLGIRSRPDLKFRNDFYDMQLLRGESLVEPVRKQRIQSSILFDEWAVNAKDEAYGGLYKYDPSAFEPGTTVTLKIRRESNLERWITVTLDAESQREIWDEFAPWREAAAKSGK